MVLKELWNLSDMLQMSFPSFTIYQDIIKEDEDKCVKTRSQNFIHEALEGGESIVESRIYKQKLIMEFMGAESRLRNVNLFHVDLLVT